MIQVPSPVGCSLYRCKQWKQSYVWRAVTRPYICMSDIGARGRPVSQWVHAVCDINTSDLEALVARVPPHCSAVVMETGHGTEVVNTVATTHMRCSKVTVLSGPGYTSLTDSWPYCTPICTAQATVTVNVCCGELNISAKRNVTRHLSITRTPYIEPWSLDRDWVICRLFFTMVTFTSDL